MTDTDAVAATYARSFPLIDMEVRSGGDGRTVTAYAAVFDTPAEIRDHQGEYVEVIDRAAFNRAIDHARPRGNRRDWLISVYYNHGRNLEGQPEPEFQMPLGRVLDVRADGRGVLTETRYSTTDVGERALTLIKDRAIVSQSFRGRWVRSDKPVPYGGFARGADGSLPTVVRQESTMSEYGPTPMAAYPEAAILGVRSGNVLAELAALDEDALAALRADPAALAALTDLATRIGPATPSGTADAPAADSPHPHLSTAHLRLRARARAIGVI